MLVGLFTWFDSEWGYLHPVAPEFLDLRIWHQNTTERDENSDDERVDERGEYSVGCVGCNELADTGVDELVDEHDEEHSTCLVRVARKTGSVVEADVIENGADDKVWDLRDD